jgi:uncharacterized glyoxalase superfamily metalloenzyme YdcJ
MCRSGSSFRAAGFKIAADIACFQSHHLNHLTPNTLCMDLYTAAMKFAFGELAEAEFRARAQRALTRLKSAGDRDFMRLCFRHLSREQIDAFAPGTPPAGFIDGLVDALARRLQQPDLQLSKLNHSGFKDFTEGPSQDTPVFLRQDAYKALTEPVEFTNPDGAVVKTTHTARFGEIEQRFYACTPAGRALYDRCLAAADALREANRAEADRLYMSILEARTVDKVRQQIGVTEQDIPMEEFKQIKEARETAEA